MPRLAEHLALVVDDRRLDLGTPEVDAAAHDDRPYRPPRLAIRGGETCRLVANCTHRPYAQSARRTARSRGCGVVGTGVSAAEEDGTQSRAAAPRFDVAVTVSVTRQRVPYGGTLRGVLRVINRGNVAVPTAEHRSMVFGQELNRPGQPHYPGKAKYAYVRSPGGNCSFGSVGGGKLSIVRL